MNFILFSESKIGIHSDIDIDCQIVPIVFVPTILKQENGTNQAFINLDNNLNIQNVISNSTTETIFLVGFDLDENGEFMAHALKNYLISKNIDKKQILRMPLAEDGYIGICDFMDISGLMTLKLLQKDFSAILKKNNLPQIELIDFLALRYLDKKKGKSISLNSDNLNEKFNSLGTSTITFITNNLLKDEIYEISN